MNNLSPRLAAVAEWVISEKPVADIGSDHAGLAIELLQSKKCPHIIITDINLRPLQRAEGLVREQGLEEQCDFRLGDGLEPLKPGEVATVCIAGMGGHTIADILRREVHKLPSYERLLLQPMNVLPPLRSYLAETGFPILRERAVREGDAGFIIMEVGTKAGPPYQLTELQAEVGPLILAHPDRFDNYFYLQLWQQKYNQRIRNMAVSSRSEVQLQRERLIRDRDQIEEVLKRC